jgi:hypothetical protein
MVVAKVPDSQTLPRFYCHVEENICEVARQARAFACGEAGDAGLEITFRSPREILLHRCAR